jgi:hypothetical protein
MSCAGLVACGGGVSIGIGGGYDFDDAPPSVTIAASTPTVVAGRSVVLVAAASDNDGIDVVAFFRLDGNIPQPLGTLANPPYELAVTAPADGRSTLRVFARAIDFSGNRSDSAVLELPIVR